MCESNRSKEKKITTQIDTNLVNQVKLILEIIGDAQP